MSQYGKWFYVVFLSIVNVPREEEPVSCYVSNSYTWSEWAGFDFFFFKRRVWVLQDYDVTLVFLSLGGRKHVFKYVAFRKVFYVWN